MAKTVFDVLIEQLEIQKDSVMHHLRGGSPKDYAGYREAVGVIRGIEYSMQTINDLAKNYVDGGEEDE